MVKLVVIGLLVIWILYKIWISKLDFGQIKENFCFDPYGNNLKEDEKSYKKYLNWFKETYPCCKKAYMLGYDNPYLYPYDYDSMNLNHPIGRFKYPGWVRQMVLDGSNYKGFPGYGY